MIDLNKMFTFDKKFFAAMGRGVVKRHRSLVRNKGLDADSKPFKPYTAEYERRKKAGKYKGQNMAYAKGNVNLSLTGKMLDSLRLIKVLKFGFRYGITAKIQARKMIGHFTGRFGKNKGTVRKISTEKNPMHEEIQDIIMTVIAKKGQNNIRKEIRKQNFGKKVIEI